MGCGRGFHKRIFQAKTVWNGRIGSFFDGILGAEFEREGSLLAHKGQRCGFDGLGGCDAGHENTADLPGGIPQQLAGSGGHPSALQGFNLLPAGGGEDLPRHLFSGPRFHVQAHQGLKAFGRSAELN